MRFSERNLLVMSGRYDTWAPSPPPDREALVMTAPVLFDAALRAGLEANLARLDRLSTPLDGHRHAAVAVVVVDSEAGTDPGTGGGAAVLLTRRAVRLQAHAGQWALPGGRVEEGEDPFDAARRELREELGLDLDEASLVGALDDYATRSGYVITPYVLWGGRDPELTPDPAEVRSVHRVSFTELCRPDSPRFVSIPESDRPVVQVPVGGDLIHAPTGAVLLQFRRVAIEGVVERVADYEQPVFAWR
jgi:8-oxo-dGTP pyrophosphatase MutT (NUDIX family)